MSAWWYGLDGEHKGPVSDVELRDLLISGTLVPASLVWKEGLVDWQPAASLEELAPLQPPVERSAEEPGDGAWWFVLDGKRRGPVSYAVLRVLLIDGKLTPTSRIWTEGMDGWQPAASIGDISPVLASQSPELPHGQSALRLTPRAGAWRHLGSTGALLVGCLYFIYALAVPGSGAGLMAGPIMVLGALAYRSAKKRKLSEVKSTLTRRFLELALILLICPMMLTVHNPTDLIATEPVPYFLIPVWAILAYLVITLTPEGWWQTKRVD